MSGLRLRYAGVRDYREIWESMRRFVAVADGRTEEEVWFLQHPPVYTLGRTANRRHLLRMNDIPVVESDRGGQVTYHAPGQLVAYPLVNLHRRKLGLRDFVRRLEEAVIRLLADYGVVGEGSVSAPGVYVSGAKIAALGLRLCRGWTYHGIALNVDLDLRPFADINPCGYEGLAVTRTKDWNVSGGVDDLAPELAGHFQQLLSR